MDQLMIYQKNIKNNQNNKINENKGLTLTNKNSDESEKGGGCCSGKKDKKKNKSKIVKKSEVIENNDKYIEF